ncbi:MAG TPA: hypothetical protein PLS69_08600, partial [Terricaulis sp.]|nr:hypothetical protein [Terricaulis sp.]
ASLCGERRLGSGSVALQRAQEAKIGIGQGGGSIFHAFILPFSHVLCKLRNIFACIMADIAPKRR